MQSQSSSDHASFDATAVRLRYHVDPDPAKVPNYLKAVKLIVEQAGGLTPSKAEALTRGMNLIGISPDLQAEIKAFDPTSSSLAALIPDLKQGGVGARMLLRDAIEIEGGDGSYSAREKQAMAKVAAQLGVDGVTLRTIEALVDMEHAVHRLRSALYPIQ